MATNLPAPPPSKPARSRLLSRARYAFLLAMAALFAICIVFIFMTRDVMSNLPFLRRGADLTGLGLGQQTLVDISPWQTVEAIAPLAVTAEEKEFAHEAEHLADHEVDQAFAAALRRATTKHAVLSPEAQKLQQQLDQVQQQVQQDQQLVQKLTPAAPAGATAATAESTVASSSNDLEIAKAQLGLDTDELKDAQQDFNRASGDQRDRIEQELASHQAAVAKLNTESQSRAQTAVMSAAQYGTLAGRIRAWLNQRSRYQSVQQALQQARKDEATLTGQHNQLEAQANASQQNAADADYSTRLANIRKRSAERQLLSIYDDRIQTQQQLVNVYTKWSTQVLLQHRILLHLILQSLATIAFIFIGVVLCDALVRRISISATTSDRPTLDRRRMQTLRTILELAVQVVGIILVLVVIFGTPSQMPTILGLMTAGITVVCQDFILAFFGWFVLMGKNGIRVGDWVEINGVGGEVIEISLFRTTMLETGNWTDKGHPTGRRVTFINNFAINGQYFNFSTTGQWMWDEISLNVPTSDDTYATVESIHKAVVLATEQDAHDAQEEWKHSARQNGLSQFSATPAVNLRPSGSGMEIVVRYVTRASERFDVRNRIYQRIIEILHIPNTPPASPSQVQPAG
jgi:small-conductance mechanosensitive channel